MENTKYMYDMITQKLEVKLTEHFQENEPDANKQEEAQNLLKKHFAECRKQIDSYNNRIHFYDRVETMKKAMESFENKMEAEKENNTPKRTIRFFDDVESSVNSLCIDNKRDFANKLSEIDAEYQKILTRLMDELSTKKGDIKHQI